MRLKNLISLAALLTATMAGHSAHSKAKVVPYDRLAKAAEIESQLDRSSRLRIASKKAMEEDKPLTGFLTTFTSRGLDEYADTYGLNLGLNLIYKAGPNRLVGFVIEYSTILSRPEDGRILANYAADTSRFGLGDLRLFYLIPRLNKTENTDLTWRNTLTLPTSEVSRRASMVGEFSTGLALKIDATKMLDITPGLGAYFRHHEFDDADVGGTRINSPFGFTGSLAMTLKPIEWFNWATTFSLTQRHDYANMVKPIQSLVTTGSLALSERFSFFTSYTWRDAVITNDKIFSDDNSEMGLGLNLVF